MGSLVTAVVCVSSHMCSSVFGLQVWVVAVSFTQGGFKMMVWRYVTNRKMFVKHVRDGGVDPHAQQCSHGLGSIPPQDELTFVLYCQGPI